MDKIRTVWATTRVDRHGGRFTREALEGAAEQARSAYIPILFNHDPRVPPLGRTGRTFVEELPDGEWALVAESEIFETSGPLPPLASDREMLIHTYPLDRITIVRDRSYRHSDDVAILDELARDLSVRIEVMEKKALEPLSVLLLAVSAASAAFAGGFLSKMGSDAWDYLKPKISQLLTRRHIDQPEYLFVFEVQAHRTSGIIAIQCILTNPSQEDIDRFWSEGLRRLDTLLPAIISFPDEICKVVVTYSGGGLHAEFAVRKDCVALNWGFSESRKDG